MKILYSPASPYSAKVRMAARHCGLACESQIVDTKSDPAVLTESNPLGKIPTLIDDRGIAIYDSRVIMQFLDHASGRKLFPRNTDKRNDALILEALCDGITDCLLAIVYEQRFRPHDKRHDPWIERQWAKAERGLDHLNSHMPRTTKNLHGGHFALAALLGYLTLRFEGKWERGRPKLKNWPMKFNRFFGDYDRYKPQA